MRLISIAIALNFFFATSGAAHDFITQEIADDYVKKNPRCSRYHESFELGIRERPRLRDDWKIISGAEVFF